MSEVILNHLENEIDCFAAYYDGDYWEDEGLDLEDYLRKMNFNGDCIKKWLDVNAL